ncbi:MAG: ATP synthase F1 subunit epsilon [Clostridiales Family XIII bacterium]|jgi:F-type H+-transporting ATPase subunit epsilon|nr:ATP synthase F1 subunit epsilon [Clostridiales Family XIII bacterium]
MANTIRLEIVTPEKLFYEGDVEMAIARTVTGDEGFMANHAWACKLLSTGELWIKEAGSKEYRIAAISGGFIDVKDEIMIFADAAEWPEEIDLARTEIAKLKAEEWLEKHDLADSEADEVEEKKAALDRAQNRENVSKGGSVTRK